MGAICGKEKAPTAMLTSAHFPHRFVFSIHQSFDSLYEVVEVIGHGSTAKISRIKRRETPSIRRPSSLLRRSRSSRISLPERADTVAGSTAFEQSNSKSPVKYYALKEIDVNMIKAEILDEFENEIRLLKGLDHPHIVRALETYRLHRNRIAAIVMEMCEGGDLHSRPPCSERDAATIIEQVLSAVAYLHDRNIVHRDLKFQNILYVDKENLDVKLIDFGLAKKYILKGDRHYERCGTLYTMSPEAIQGCYTGSSTDLWSVGVIAYMLLSNEMPFSGKDPKEVKQQIRTKEIKFEGMAWERISKDAKDFVLSLLQRNPDDRPTAKEALKHKFIQNRSKLSNKSPNPDVVRNIPNSMLHFGESSNLKKIALQIIASRSSSDEIFELRQLFDEYDKSCDGSLSYSDFKDCLSRLNYSDAELKSIFSQVEVNHTGRILYTEFLACTLEAQGNLAQHKIMDAFRQFDRSSKGFIDKEDLRKVLPKTITDKEIDKIMTEVGAQQGGKISFDQFSNALTCVTQRKIRQIYEDKPKIKAVNS